MVETLDQTHHEQLQGYPKMQPNWKDEDPTNFARVRDQRFPAIQQASRHLQPAIGIPPGTKMIGEASVLLWLMPDPPMQTTTQMFESLKAKMGLCGAKRSNVVDANAESTKDEFTIKKHPPRRSFSSSMTSNIRRPEPGMLIRPASPPPSWVSNPRTVGTKHIPPYWCHTLSQNISRWLEQPGTRSLQFSLLKLDLRGLSPDRQLEATHLIDIDPACYAKVKLSRLSLPASIVAQKGVPMAMGPPSPLLLDWLVLQISYKIRVDLDDYDIDDSGSDESDIIPLPFGVTPHWVIAFPLQAITATRMEYESVPVSLLPLPRPQSREKQKKNQPVERMVHVTKLCLGYTGRIPLAHGRGVNPHFVQGFMEACAEGRGIVELRTLEAVAPMLQMR